jgi:hypothetical protein
MTSLSVLKIWQSMTVAYPRLLQPPVPGLLANKCAQRFYAPLSNKLCSRSGSSTIFVGVKLTFQALRDIFRCHAAGLPSPPFGSSAIIRSCWGLVKRLASVFALECVCRLLVGSVSSLVTGTGAENLSRSILQVYKSFGPHYLVISAVVHSKH